MNKLSLCIIGTGYVGLVTGLCFADFGYDVICVDNDPNIILSLNDGIMPIYEPGIKEIYDRVNHSKKIIFTVDIQDAIKKTDVIFICVGTPSDEDGSADLQHVISVAKTIGENIDKYKVVVDKSTVPVGTSVRVRETIQKEIDLKGQKIEFDVVSNPEFLREGKALYDFTHPDRVVLGVESKRALEIMKVVYKPLKINEVPFVETNCQTAELIKYASNAFLAVKIGFINEIANLCEPINADVHMIAKAMGMDGRISPKFLHPGPGYGGSCFPKDTRALVKTAQDYQLDMKITSAAIKANEHQKQRMVEKITKVLGSDLKNKKIAVLGLTFKAETDDVRESCSLVIIPELLKLGATVNAFDPKGADEFKNAIGCISDKHIIFCSNEYDAAKGADALVILTEWSQFRRLDLKQLKETMNSHNFFDFRNLYDKEQIIEYGFYYEGVGR